MIDKVSVMESYGLGSDINAALIDAINNVKGRDDMSEAHVEVVAFGAKEIAVGGAISFWVKVRVVRNEEPRSSDFTE